MCQCLKVSLSACTHINCLNIPNLRRKPETNAPQQLVHLFTMSCTVMALDLPLVFLQWSSAVSCGHVYHLIQPIANGVTHIQDVFAA